MNFLKKFFPFVPGKGEIGKLILGLLFYLLLTLVGIPVVVIALALTIFLAVLVPILVLLIIAYSIFGTVMVILGFCGALDSKKDN